MTFCKVITYWETKTKSSDLLKKIDKPEEHIFLGVLPFFPVVAADEFPLCSIFPGDSTVEDFSGSSSACIGLLFPLESSSGPGLSIELLGFSAQGS